LIEGVSQAVIWNLDSDTRHVVTSNPFGVELSEIEPNGEYVWWFDSDHTGVGTWFRQSIVTGVRQTALQGVPPGKPRGIGFDHDGRLAAICIGAGEGSRCFAGRPGQFGEEVYAASTYRHLVDVSPDGTTLAFAGSPDGADAVVIRTVSTGEITALGCSHDSRLWPLEFRPSDAVGVSELLLVEETLHGFSIGTWSANTGLLLRPRITFPTTISASWYTGGSQTLVQHEFAGRSRLLIVDLDTADITELAIPEGTVHDLSCEPDGTVHYLLSSGGVPATHLKIHPLRGDVASKPTNRTSGGDFRAQTDFWTPTEYGNIHSLLTTPPTEPPWPVVFLIHGGPYTHDRDSADARVAALVAAGYAVVRTNYRGSTGYGHAWQRGFGNRVGLAQLDDLAAVLGQLVDRNLATRDRVALCGYSWGGYLALLGMGVQPELWSAAVAVYPIADYVRCFSATTPVLRNVDIELFGGTPQEFPERFLSASPITYVGHVRGPLLVIGDREDERCPPDQIESYIQCLRDHCIPHEVVWRQGGGHGKPQMIEQASIFSLVIGFLDHWQRSLSDVRGASAPEDRECQEGGTE
jgi:acylaminoacyl-peptidase